jgi:hypothetical protein
MLIGHASATVRLGKQRSLQGGGFDRELTVPTSNPYRSMEGGSVGELLDVTVERPLLH